jgi:hypothetical protein
MVLVIVFLPMPLGPGRAATNQQSTIDGHASKMEKNFTRSPGSAFCESEVDPLEK